MSSDAEARYTSWTSYTFSTGVGMSYRFRRTPDGRLVISDLYIEVGEGGEITSSTLRELPITAVEAQANALARLERGPARGARDPDDEPSFADLRRKSERERAQHGKPRKPRIGPPRRQMLTRPDGTDPDAFYRDVAVAYAEYAGKTRAVAAALAEEADVPVGTVRNWIREARRRGYLPPGRKGKAG